MVVIIIIAILTPGNLKSTEGFSKYCTSCGYKSEYTCSECVNCGYCVTASGYGGCVPGDERGPYFAEDCVRWYYDYIPYYDNHIFPRLGFRRYYDYYRRPRIGRRLRLRRVKS